MGNIKEIPEVNIPVPEACHHQPWCRGVSRIGRAPNKHPAYMPVAGCAQRQKISFTFKIFMGRQTMTNDDYDQFTQQTHDKLL
jgi:hypothetical protein